MFLLLVTLNVFNIGSNCKGYVYFSCVDDHNHWEGSACSNSLLIIENGKLNMEIDDLVKVLHV